MPARVGNPAHAAAVAACASLLLTACAGAPPASPPVAATAAIASTAPVASIPTGGPHDFDFLEGAWSTTQHRLKARGVGSHDWDEFPAKSCVSRHLGGLVSTDEMVFPTRGWSGVTLRAFDVQKKTWLIYWVSSRTGILQPPVAGGFTGNRGEFYGDDDDDGRPIRARFYWTSIDANHAHWEQAFSYDGGKQWETNWTADFTRADEAATCDHGRPQ
jgi:hypothetical protein